MEEIFWKQKASLNWAQMGEKNTKYFHAAVKNKRLVNKIDRIKLNDGNFSEEREEIQRSGIEYFEALLTDGDDWSPPLIFPRIPAVLGQQESIDLVAAPNSDEVWAIIGAMSASAAAGPDGFNALFYQYAWEVIKDDVMEAILDFYSGAIIPRYFTSTALVLIPKSDNPEGWDSYRPISLCSVFSRILSKCMARKLTPLLGRIISLNQTGFVKGRVISENFLLAQEMVHEINRKHRGGNVVIKLDMSKAYDRVNWSFLVWMLRQFGFREEWLKLVGNLISNCWFSLLINGESCGYFKSTRGLRQGDPISPSLFIIAAEFFSRGLNELVDNFPAVRFHAGCSVAVSHLAYADDLLIFMNGSSFSLSKILEMLKLYEDVSGQRCNKEKSCVIFGKHMGERRREEFIRKSGFREGCLPTPYLGGMLHKGKAKEAMFDGMVGRMIKKITAWENKFLSFGGRLVLLQSVLNTIPLYSLQLMKPPMSVLNNVEKLWNKFLWGSKEGCRKTHWSSWKDICYPKEEGGLGFRRLKNWGKTFAMKWWWNFRAQTSLWALFIKARYGKNLPCLGVEPVQHSSSSWKWIAGNKNLIEGKLRWAVGRGCIFFWFDHWCICGVLAEVLP